MARVKTLDLSVESNASVEEAAGVVGGGRFQVHFGSRGIGLSYGNRGRGHGHGHGHGGGLYGGFGGYARPTWHDTSHYDYHPPTVVPHGNHFDYVPGHYHYHRTGHWHP